MILPELAYNCYCEFETSNGTGRVPLESTAECFFNFFIHRVFQGFPCTACPCAKLVSPDHLTTTIWHGCHLPQRVLLIIPYRSIPLVAARSGRVRHAGTVILSKVTKSISPSVSLGASLSSLHNLLISTLCYLLTSDDSWDSVFSALLPPPEFFSAFLTTR